MSKLIWVAVLAVGCGAPFESELFGGSPDGGALDGEITPQGDAMGDALPDALDEVDGGAGGAQSGAGGALVGAGGVAETAGGRPSTGGQDASGGRPSSGGAASGGTSSGGTPPAAGGAPPCNVSHDNGFGQTWEDCAPRGTYNLDQAMRACEVSGATDCRLHDERAACGRVAVCADVDEERRCWLYDINAGQVWPDVCVMPGSGAPLWG